MKMSGWLSIAVAACAVLFFGVQMINGKSDAVHHGDEAELRKRIDLPFKFDSVKWEIFPVPEFGLDSVPGPDDYRVLVAQFEGAEVQEDIDRPVVRADFFYNSARPWISDVFQDFIRRTLDAGNELPQKSICTSLDVSVPPQASEKTSALLCRSGGKLLVHVIVEER